MKWQSQDSNPSGGYSKAAPCGKCYLPEVTSCKEGKLAPRLNPLTPGPLTFPNMKDWRNPLQKAGASASSCCYHLSRPAIPWLQCLRWWERRTGSQKPREETRVTAPPITCQIFINNERRFCASPACEAFSWTRQKSSYHTTLNGLRL